MDRRPGAAADAGNDGEHRLHLLVPGQFLLPSRRIGAEPPDVMLPRARRSLMQAEMIDSVASRSATGASSVTTLARCRAWSSALPIPPLFLL
jgi:hypothetical protein